MNPKLAKRYLDDGMATIPKPQLLLRLYERLLADLQRAVVALQAAEIETSHNELLHAQEIVYELNLALDVDRWAEGRTLRSIYQHLTELLVTANTAKRPEPAIEAIEIVSPLCDAWREALAANAAPGGGPSAGSSEPVRTSA